MNDGPAGGVRMIPRMYACHDCGWCEVAATVERKHTHCHQCKADISQVCGCENQIIYFGEEPGPEIII
eukprot:g5812.t1